MQIVFWTSIDLANSAIIKRLQSETDVCLIVSESLATVLAAFPVSDGLLLYDPPIDQARLMTAALAAPDSRIPWMHILTTGRDRLEAAGIPPEITVSSAIGASAPTVAEHAIALLLALMRRIPQSVAFNIQAVWDRSPAAQCSTLEDANLVIVGYGPIGQEIAKRAHAFGARVSVISRSSHTDEYVEASYLLGDLHRVLSGADAVVVAIALKPETYRLFDADTFAAFKKAALFVNVSRGGVVDQNALLDALKSGQLGGVGLDVTTPEPLPDGDPLWHAPNIVITPHYAGGAGSQPTIGRIVDGVIAAIDSFRQSRS